MNNWTRRTWVRFLAGIAVCGGNLPGETGWSEIPSQTNTLRESATAAITNRPGGQDILERSPAREQMYAGMLHVQDKEYEKAVPKLEFAIKEDPTLLGAWEALGWAYWNLERKDETQRLWERLQRLDPREPLTFNLLAQVANSRGDLEKAGSLLKESLDLNPDQYEVRYWYAQNLLWCGHSEQAMPMLRQLLVEDPERMDVRIELARTLTELMEYEDALDHWAIINDAIPDNPDYLIPEAQSLLRIGEIRQAESTALHVLDLAPDNLQALNLLADIAENGNNQETAVKALRKLANRTENKNFRCRLYLRLSNLQKAMSVQDPVKYPVADAIMSARKALDDDPRYVSGRLYLGELYSGAMLHGEAEEVFKTVLKDYNPGNLRAKKGLIECYLATARFEECERMILDAYRNFNPSDPYRHLYIARLEFARGKPFEAMRELDLLEAEGLRGAVFTSLYHGLSTSEWDPAISTRRFQEHLLSLKRAGYKFISADRIPAYFAAHKAPELPVGKPWLYRMFRSLEYDFTGKEAPA
ncbi:MAG: tetratricopeptide repeat protein, partial [bacterium]